MLSATLLSERYLLILIVMLIVQIRFGNNKNKNNNNNKYKNNPCHLPCKVLEK